LFYHKGAVRDEPTQPIISTYLSYKKTVSPKDINTVLLVNPWIHDFAAFDFWAKPLGLLTVGAVLRTNGYTLSFVDCLAVDDSLLASMPRITIPRRKPEGKGKYLKQRIEKPPAYRSIERRYSRYGLPPAMVAEKLERIAQPTAVLVTSGMTYWYPGVFETIALIKCIFPHTPVMLGGVYAGLCPDHARMFSGADLVITGPGEQAVLDVLSSLTGRKHPYHPNLEDPDSLPYPAFDLYDALPYLTIATSRGCPFRCRYCASRLLNPSYTVRSARSVVDEIIFWQERTGVTNIAFYDDALFFNTSHHIVPILKRVISSGIHASFHTPNGIHVQGITVETASLMKEAGFQTIRLGLETADEECMARTGKKTSQREFLQAVRSLHAAGYKTEDIGVYLLAGLPNQTAQEVEYSIRFAQEAGARPYLAEYSPIPATSLWDEACAVSRFDLRSDPLYHNNSIFPCAWEGFTRSDLQRLKELLRT